MHLEFASHVHASVAEVFDFFQQPENLTLLLRGWPSFRLIRCAKVVRTGGHLWIEENAAGLLPIAMGFEFIRFEPGVLFSERIIHGPFSVFDHAHKFEADANGTVVRDTIECELKWPYGGAPATAFLVAPRLRRLFAYRAERLKALLGNAEARRKEM